MMENEQSDFLHYTCMQYLCAVVIVVKSSECTVNGWSCNNVKVYDLLCCGYVSISM